MRQDTVLAGLMGFVCVVLIAAIVIAVFYFLTLMKALTRVAPRNRLMEPGLVWLGFIPLFNVVWSFFIATRVPDSLRNEFRDQGRDDGSDYGRGIGLTNAILGAVSIPISLMAQFSRDPFMDMINLPISLASLILFVIFWVRIAGYSSRLAAPAYYPGSASDYGRDNYGRDEYGRGGYGDEGSVPPEPRGPSSDAIRPDDPGHYR